MAAEVRSILEQLGKGEITPERAVEAAKVSVKNTTGRKFTPPDEAALLGVYDQDEKMRERALKAKVPFIHEDSEFTLYPGLVLIGGVSGKGKSTLAANVVAGLLTSRPEGKALVISNEESLGSIYNRVACILLGLNFMKFHHGNYVASVVQKVREATKDIVKRVTVCQVDGWDMSVMEDVQAMLVYAAESGAALALADYFQTINVSRNEPELESFAVHKKFGFWLKDYARRVPMPIAMFAQLKTQPKDQKLQMEIKDRVEGDKTIVNHAFQVIEVLPDFDAKKSTFKMHKDRFGGQTNNEITMRYVDGAFIAEGGL